MKEYTINLKNVSTYSNFYEQIKNGLNLPDWCGQNPDAIWDMLTGYIEHPATIYVTGSSFIPASLTDEYELILKIFNNASLWYDDTCSYLNIEITK